MQRALVGGSIVALFTSIMGVFAVLRGASFFGDAISHSSLAGAAVGLLFGINPLLTAALVGVTIALTIPYFEKKGEFRMDTVLGFLMPFSMAFGVLALSLLPGYQPELISFLFGSILSISWGSIKLVFIISIVALFTVLVLRKKLLSIAFDSEYSKVSGINVNRFNLLHNVLVALAVVASIKLVGVLLVNALLVIPAATSKLFAKNVHNMFVFAPLLALIGVLIGLLVSFFLNLPSGPAIVGMLGILFLIGLISKKQ